MQSTSDRIRIGSDRIDYINDAVVAGHQTTKKWLCFSDTSVNTIIEFCLGPVRFFLGQNNSNGLMAPF